MTMQEVANILAPLLVFLGVAGGWWVGRKRQVAEVESLSVTASKVAVDSLLSTVQPLKDQVRRLEAEIEALKQLNEQLVRENETLRRSISDLRALFMKDDEPA